MASGNKDDGKTKHSSSRAYALSYNNPLNNPCVKEQNLSLKCLDENIGDKDACEPYFFNYKACKDFWSVVKRERTRDGISPALPPPEERDDIKARRLKFRQS